MRMNINGWGGLLLATAFSVSCGDAGDQVVVSEQSQALNAAALEHMEMVQIPGSPTTFSAYHNIRYSDGTWQGYASPGTPRPSNSKVEGSMLVTETHWIQYGRTLFHNRRLSNGNWQPGGWQQVPNTFDSSNAEYIDVGMAEIGNELHVCSVVRFNGSISSGVLYHQIRNGDTWTQQLPVQIPQTGPVDSVDCAGWVNGSLAVVYSVGTDFYIATRIPGNPDTNWITTTTPLSHLTNYFGAPLALTNIGGILHLTTIAEGTLKHRTIPPIGSPSSWGTPPFQNGRLFSDVSTAEVSGLLHVIALATDGRAYHTIRFGASWQNPIGQIPTTIGTPVASVAAAGSVAPKP